MNSEYLICYLINLYVYVTNNPIISISNLSKAFNTLKNIIEEDYNTHFNLDFTSSLKNMLENYPEYLTSNNTELELTGDLDELFIELENDLELSEIDYSIEDYINNIYVYEDLDLYIPLKETEPIFNINKEITNIYVSIAKSTLKNDNYTLFTLIYKLNYLINKLNNITKNLNDTNIYMLRMCFAKYNLCLSSKSTPFINKGWNIALFPENQDQITKLNYERLEYLIDQTEYNSFLKENDLELLEPLNEIDVYLNHFLILLDEYLKNNNLNPDIKTILTIKEYLLLSTPELNNAEEYFLYKGTLDDLPELPLNDYNFEILNKKILECILELNIPDNKINNNLYSILILRALFIKTYFDLSIDNISKEQYTKIIITSNFYNNKNYNIVINLINNIIFQDKPKRTI